MAGPNTTTTATLFTCPACQQNVEATFVLEFSLDPSVPVGGGTIGSVAAVAETVGVKVAHDCAPRVVRKHRATKAADDAEAAPASPVPVAANGKG